MIAQHAPLNARINNYGKDIDSRRATRKENNDNPIANLTQLKTEGVSG